jgi:transposase-like protein
MRPSHSLWDSQMLGHGSKYSRKKEAAIEALLTKRNVEEAARAAGIGKQTLVRWMKLPEFQADVLEARRTAVSQTNGRLQHASGAAASTLFKIMMDENASHSARVCARRIPYWTVRTRPSIARTSKSGSLL